MKRFFTSLSLFLSLTTAYAQQTAYRDFDVTQPAQPQGGLPTLAQFLATNFRKPFLAQVANVKGTVLLQGVVEPDGRISDVSVLRSFRPDCDREAVRVFSLFNAWQPAQKDGKAVRQWVNIPVTVRSNQPLLYENGIAIRYYDAMLGIIPPSDTATFRSEVPTDSLGLPTGKLVFFKRNKTKWKEEVALNLSRTPSGSKRPKPTFIVGHRDDAERQFGYVYEADAAGSVYDERIYNVDRKLVQQTRRDNKGLVVSLDNMDSDQPTSRTWYANGQLQQITVRPVYQPLQNSQKPEQMLAYWDSTGTPIVSEGNGQLVRVELERSMQDTTRQTLFTEQGQYERGYKQGIWTGQYADGSYNYREEYNKGVLISGRAFFANQPDTLRYTTVEQQPEFQGGMQGLGQFLAQNLRYPVDAQRARAQGRVFVSFVVCTDGTLCDYQVLKGVHPAADAEALRVVKASSGLWKPGIQRGRPVRVKYNLPINFSLQ